MRPYAGKALARGSLVSANAVLVYLALLKLLLHLFTVGNYGYFRNELYIAASERLDLSYVGLLSFVALVTTATRAVLGDSLSRSTRYPSWLGVGYPARGLMDCEPLPIPPEEPSPALVSSTL